MVIFSVFLSAFWCSFLSFLLLPTFFQPSSLSVHFCLVKRIAIIALTPRQIAKNDAIAWQCYLGKLRKSHLWRVLKRGSMWVVWDESVCGSLLRCLRPGVRPLKLWVQHTSHSLHLRVSHMWIPTWERQRDTVSSSSWSCSRAFFSPTKPTLPVSQGFSGAGLI